MVLIFDGAGRILLVRNPETNAWHVPGGYLEPGESMEDAARREAREECHIRVEKLRLFDVFSGAELYWTYPNGDQVYNVTTAFIAERWSGTPRADGKEGAEISFFELSRLPESLGPPARIVLDALLGQR